MPKQYKQGCVVVLECEERLDAAQAQGIKDTVARLLTEGSTAVVCDLRKTRVIDSQGLELLLDTAQACARKHGCLRLASANELCRDILTVTGVGNQIESYHDTLSAVGAFSL
jgi:anti-anti-sigma factor